MTNLAAGEIAHRWPQILPGGKAVLFSAYTSMTGLDGATIEVQSLKDGRRKTLVRGGAWGRYLPSGHLVYLAKGTLFAVPFDADRLQVLGTPTPVLDEVAYSTAWGSAQIDFSRTGTLVYRAARAGGGLVTVQWLDDSGNTRPLLPVPGNYLSPTLSPDGSRLALTSAGDIWVYELGRESMIAADVRRRSRQPAVDNRRPLHRVSGGSRHVLDARRWNRSSAAIDQRAEVSRSRGPLRPMASDWLTSKTVRRGGRNLDPAGWRSIARG